MLSESTCHKSKELITPYLLFGVVNTSPLKFSARMSKSDNGIKNVENKVTEI